MPPQKKCAKSFFNFMGKTFHYVSGTMTSLINGAKGIARFVESSITPTPTATVTANPTLVPTTLSQSTTAMTKMMQNSASSVTASLTTSATTTAAPATENWLVILRDTFLSKAAWGVLGGFQLINSFFELHFAAKSTDSQNKFGHGLSALGSLTLTLASALEIFEIVSFTQPLIMAHFILEFGANALFANSAKDTTTADKGIHGFKAACNLASASGTVVENGLSDLLSKACSLFGTAGAKALDVTANVVKDAKNDCCGNGPDSEHFYDCCDVEKAEGNSEERRLLATNNSDINGDKQQQSSGKNMFRGSQ